VALDGRTINNVIKTTVYAVALDGRTINISFPKLSVATQVR
jgi:hypothetical protein